MFAVISIKGNQYLVKPDQEYKIDLLDAETAESKKIVVSDVLLISEDGKKTIGAPSIEGATVEAEFLKNIKDKKVESLKFHAKKRYKRNLGHRQNYSVIKILKINAPKAKLKTNEK